MLTYSELHDDALVDTLAHDPRTGCLALWSVTLVFVLPGLLDHERALLVVGIALGCAAAFASGRCIVRASDRRRSAARFRPVGAPALRRRRPARISCRTAGRNRVHTGPVVTPHPCDRSGPPTPGSARPRRGLRLRRRGCARSPR